MNYKNHQGVQPNPRACHGVQTSALDPLIKNPTFNKKQEIYTETIYFVHFLITDITCTG